MCHVNVKKYHQYNEYKGGYLKTFSFIQGSPILSLQWFPSCDNTLTNYPPVFAWVTKWYLQDCQEEGKQL